MRQAPVPIDACAVHERSAIRPVRERDRRSAVGRSGARRADEKAGIASCDAGFFVPGQPRTSNGAVANVSRVEPVEPVESAGPVRRAPSRRSPARRATARSRRRARARRASSRAATA
ncbi:hypothetical protein EGY16_13810 [Burkholderia pseudomallei]|nr:hypothetical protein EGY16_13810 [Burkholderia pseudomallei]TPE97402.1 hypothetical protein DIS09_17265 [Burkholderia pseudomallei]